MSEIKVNKLTPRTNCGTVQLGDSGDTITIPSGATITNNGTAAGFGATGAASWDTTVKTASFTGVAGVGYFVNTTSGAITVTLPASPDAGAVIAIKDYANTFDTNNVTLARNGSNIGGSAVDATLSTEGLAITLVYVDSTKGWLVTDDGLQSQAPTSLYISATGGTITECGNFKIHTFTGPGTFCVSCAGNAGGSNTVDYLVVAGGGGGGVGCSGGGGGAGGFRESCGGASGCYATSPLANSCGALPVSVQGYPITVGGGGSTQGPFTALPTFPSPTKGDSGTNSIFSTITSTGGGGGGGSNEQAGNNGGSGGGGAHFSSGAKGSGNTPPVSPPQGNDGATPNPGTGPAPSDSGGGGGGATAVGEAAPAGRAGGAGATTSINGTSTAYAGGGGGSNRCGGDANDVAGGTGGGGRGGFGPRTPATPGPEASGVAGTANTGGGGGAGKAITFAPENRPYGGGGTGGSGIVIIRYKFQ